MLVCLDQRTGTGCGAVNQDNAQFCKQCGRALRFALQLHNPGEVIGAYRIVRVIGHGGFGAVYEVQETALPNPTPTTPPPPSATPADTATATTTGMPHSPRRATGTVSTSTTPPTATRAY